MLRLSQPCNDGVFFSTTTIVYDIVFALRLIELTDAHPSPAVQKFLENSWMCRIVILQVQWLGGNIWKRVRNSWRWTPRQ